MRTFSILHSPFSIPRPRRGFTLLELVLTIGIASAVATVAVRVYFTIAEARTKAGVVEEVQANVRLALDVLTDRIRAAASLNGGASVLGVDPGVLTLRMSDVARDPTIFSLSANDGTLLIREGATASGTLTSTTVQVTNFVVTNVAPVGAPANIRVDLTVGSGASGTGAGYAYTETVHTAASLRR
jgi:prepilin-type N-terminal cleavage/methylation domain-containing protein